MAIPRFFLCVPYFFFQAEDGIRDVAVTGVQTCALPISDAFPYEHKFIDQAFAPLIFDSGRSEEHTSELQSRLHLVCRLLLEKKKNLHETLKNSLSSREDFMQRAEATTR